MAPRSTWKGFLRLSLVSVPVKAYSATASGAEVRLNQLHNECHNRVRYQKRCPEHGDISNDEIVSGYEYSKGQYVVIDPEEVDKLRTESDRSVQIDGFIAPTEIDPVYHAGRTYYLVPDGAVGQKPYALLRKVMLDDGVVAIAQVVLSGREQVVLVRPLGELLAMTVLSFKAKVKAIDAFTDEAPSGDVADEEVKLTKMLVDASKLEEFDFASYTDQYVTKLTKLIEAKVAGQEIVQVADAEEPRILNLMEALKESVAKAQGDAEPAPAKKKAKKKASGGSDAKKKAKMAPSSRNRKKTAARRRNSG